jgi:hypothetical protein
MEDYEVRDVMFREQTPDIVLNFLVEVTSESHSYEVDPESPKPFPFEIVNYNLIVQARNNGSAFAQYVACFLDVPVKILKNIENKMSLKDGGKMYRHRLTNLNQEFADEQFRSNFPLLRSMTMSWKISLNENFDKFKNADLSIKWKIYADNALPKEGKFFIREIEIVDLRRNRQRL